MTTAIHASPMDALHSTIQHRFGGRFAVGEILCEFPTRVVAAGWDIATGEQVLLESATSLGRGIIIGLEHETAALQRIDSKYLPKPIDVAFQSQSAVIVDPCIQGNDLRQLVGEDKLDVPSAITLAKSLFAGLRDLHEAGVYHLDVRPEKLVVQEDGTAKLLRRNIAGELISEERAEDRIWRISYVSPEQAGSIERDAAAPADLYSAGAVLFYMLAGRPPFVASDVSSILLAHMTSPVPSFRALGLSIPRSLEGVVQRLLSKDPSDRYQTAEAVLFDLDQIGIAFQKGVSEPQIVIGSHDDRATLIEPSFVGRRNELERILAQMQNAADGKSGLVLLEGLSGSGKSRLLVEVCQRAVAQGFHLFRGQGINDSARGALSMLDGAVEDLVSVARNNHSFRDYFLRAFEGDLSELVSVLPKVAEIVDGDRATRPGREDFAEERTLRTLCNFLDALGAKETPALIVLDDCQWADAQTYKLLSRWVAQVHSRGSGHVMLLLACRSEEVGAQNPLRTLGGVEHIELSSLPAKEVRLLAESMAGSLPEKATELIVSAANGSPFMAAATVRGLVETGAIVRGESGWTISEKAFAECQSSNDAGEFLTRRLELLSQPTLELLTTGAVLGKEFALDAVNHLTGQTAAATMAWFDEARKRNMVWVRGDGSQANFSHDKIREALLERLSPERRKEIHRRAAEYLAAQDHPNAIQIAFHFDAAESPQEALPYAIEAAAQAKAVSSLDVARDLYRIAQRATRISQTEPETLYCIHRGLGEVLMLQGEYDAAEECFLAGQPLAKGKLEQAQIHLKLSEVARQRGDLENAIINIEQGLSTLGYPVPRCPWQFALRLAWEILVQALTSLFPRVLLHRARRDPSASERLCMSLLSSAAIAYWYARGKSETLWAHFRELNIGEKFNPSLELASAYSEHAPAMSLLGMINRARSYAQKSFEIRKSFGDLWGQGQSRTFHAIALYSGSHFEEAIARGREAVRLLERAGDYWCVHIARYQVAASLYRLGRFREALAECEKNYESALAIGDMQSTGHIIDVWAQTTGGDVPQQFIKDELERDRIDKQTRCEVLMAAGINCMHQGKLDEAIERMEEGIRVINEAGISNCYTLPVYYWRTQALRRKGEACGDALLGSERIAALGKALRSGLRALAESWMCWNDVPRILRELALIRTMQGHPRQASWILKRSIASASRLKMHFDYAESLRVLGELQSQLGDPAAESTINQAKTLQAQIAVSFGLDETNPKAAASTTLSLADRFDTILDVGRHITTALVEKDVYEQTRLAARRLLRCEECVIVEETDGAFHIVAGEQTELDREAIRWALTKGRATVGHPEVTKESQQADSAGSIICSPIYVLGRISGCIYATHHEIRDLFGPTEERLANFISTIAGASLENAQSYYQLQELNMTLEERVAERTEAAEARARELALSNEELERTAKDLRLTEDQLREAIVEANSANEAKSQFLATMSHELRTPMNGILGMTELLTRMELTPQQKTCVNVVKQSGENLLTLINDILDLSKIEAGKMDVEQIRFELREVVENAVRLLSASADKKDLELVCEIDNNTPRCVVGDPNRIRQVLTNLIGNAIKFTSHGEIHVGVTLAAEDVLFSVRDTGIGIPADKQELIFDAFSQSDSSTTRQYGGTGLGLSICRTLVELMGGTLWVESVPGVGSTFFFQIPFQAMSGSQFDLGKNELRGLLAALICDNQTAARARQHMLECLGLSVLSFRNASEMDAEDRVAFDLFVIDEATGDGGVEFQPSVPVISITQASRITTDRGVLQISNPPVLEDLATAIEAAMSSGRAAVPAEERTTTSSGYKILVADDSIVNQEVAAGLLEISGHSVLVANNGRQAVQCFLENELDLILMDVEMPDVDGLEATRTIRQHQRGAQIPIIALSAHALPQKRQACMDAGVNEYIAKPFQPDELLETISRLVQAARANVTA